MSTYPPDLESYVQQKIASGEFESVDEFAIEAARVYREIETREAELKAKINAALAEADAGLIAPLDIDEIKNELRAKLKSNGRGR